MPKYRMKGGVSGPEAATRLADVLSHLVNLGLCDAIGAACLVEDAAQAKEVSAGQDLVLATDKELPKEQVEHLGLEEVV